VLPDVGKMSSEAPIPSDSHDITIEVHVLGCGDGDTILLRLPVDKWVMVDCHLPKAGGARDRFFEFVKSHDIQRLECVFLTHPHHDHFLGMAEVLEYFSQERRSVGTFCDGGPDAQQVQDLLGLGPGSSSYARLQEVLDKLDVTDSIKFLSIDENHYPVFPEGFEDRVELIPIAPDPTARRRLVRNSIQTLRDNSNAKLEANALSIVLVLSVQDADNEWNAILAADAGESELNTALSVWEKRAKERKRSPALDLVKVPHHGSIHSHSNALCKASRRAEKPRLAVISAGTRPGLPHRTVLENYLDAGWTVLITTKRVGPVRGNSPLDLANRKGPPPADPDLKDIKISWNSRDGMNWEPTEATIQRSELSLY